MVHVSQYVTLVYLMGSLDGPGAEATFVVTFRKIQGDLRAPPKLEEMSAGLEGTQGLLEEVLRPKYRFDFVFTHVTDGVCGSFIRKDKDHENNPGYDLLRPPDTWEWPGEDGMRVDTGQYFSTTPT